MIDFEISTTFFFFFSSRRRHTRLQGDWSSDVCSSDLDPQPLPPEAEEQLGATRVDLNRLIAESDFISVHVPLTQETLHLISTAQFNAMKRNAILVNTSRGPVVDAAALVQAPNATQLAGDGP